MFGILSFTKGEYQMSNNFIELLNIILESNNPEHTILTAYNIISDFQQRHELHQEEAVDFPQVFCQTSLLS